MKTTRSTLVSLADLLILPLLYPFASLLRKMCDVGMFRFTRCQRALLHLGVYPIRNHYYEPQFDYSTVTTLTRISHRAAVKRKNSVPESFFGDVMVGGSFYGRQEWASGVLE